MATLQLLQPLVDLLASPSEVGAGDDKDSEKVDKALLMANLDFLLQITSNPNSHSIESLKRQPALLAAEEVRLARALSNVAFSEYKAFLEAHDCCVQTRSGVAHLCSPDQIPHLHTHLLPSLRDALTQLSHTALQCTQDRATLDRVLTHQRQLAELLDIPSLFDTLVRSGSYEEAIDLQLHVQKLPLRYPNAPAIIHSIASQLRSSSRVMLAQLILLLRGPVKLPQCIRTIGYLRRMDVFGEAELRLVFLQQRDTYLTGLLGAIRQDTPSVDYLKRYLDVSREHLFDIITQYKAIFSDSTSHPSSNSAGMQDALNSSSSTSHSILASYTTYALTSLVSVLRTHLLTPRINDVASINAILTQTMYFGMSLGRVGIDFRLLVSDVFERAVERIVSSLILQGVHSFCVWIRETRLRGLYDASGAKLAGTDNTSVGDARTVTPPSALFAYPQLGHLLNAFLAAFNQLRILPCISLIQPLSTIICDSLKLVCDVMGEAGSVEWDRWADDQRRQFEDACRVLSDVLVPYIWDAFDSGVYHSIDTGGVGTGSRDAFVTGVAVGIEAWSQAGRDRIKKKTTRGGGEDAQQQPIDTTK